MPYPSPGIAEVVIGGRRVGSMAWLESNDGSEPDEIHVAAWPEDQDVVAELARAVAGLLHGTYRVLGV